jgi:hypothetical protein
LIWYLIKNSQWKYGNGFPVMERGWGNGYVAVPPTHPAYKMDYDHIDINIHGGLTLAGLSNGTYAPEGWWVFGFDTAHYNDNLERWSKEAVEAETKRLFSQLLDIELGEL